MITKPSYGKSKSKLIEAAISCLMDDGIEGCSVRKICARAGVSTGLINYHYETFQDLIADAYKELALSLLERAIEAAQSNTNNPHEKIAIFIEKAFDSTSMNKRTLRAWIVFWGMIDRSTPVREAHDVSNAAFSSFLESIFVELHQVTPLLTTPRLASIGLTAMMDGLWLEWSLQSGTFSPQEAQSLCQLWVESIIKI